MTLSKLCVAFLGLTLSCGSYASAILPLAAHCLPPEPHILQPLQPFLSQVRPKDLLADPSHVSLLITVALNQKFGRNFTLDEVINVIDKDRARPNTMSFFEVRHTLRKLGYDAVGLRFDHPLEESPRADDMMFMIDDKTYPKTRVMVLVFAASETSRHILYPNGYVCAMATDQFIQYFSHQAILFVRAAGSAVFDQAVKSTPKLTLADFAKLPEPERQVLPQADPNSKIKIHGSIGGTGKTKAITLQDLGIP